MVSRPAPWAPAPIPLMKTNSSFRRTFLQQSAVGAAAWALTPRSWAQVKGANNDIRVAVVGFRGRGQSHLADLLQVKGARIVALCDVDRQVLDRGVKFLAGKGHTAKPYTDVRQMLESREIDAVSTATPNHWHSLLTIWACQAGKDVYVEKPVSHNIWEGRQMVAAARKYGRIVQAGTQSRSDTALQDCRAWLGEGHLGRITVARGLCYKRRPSIGKVKGPQPVPSHIDYDLWTGPAEMRLLHREKLHYDWHWDFNTGNGDLGNQGIHQMDIALWFLGQKALPRRVMSVGGRVGYVDDGNTPNTQIIHLDYPEAPLVFEVRGLNANARTDRMDTFLGAGYGNVFHCENGFVVAHNGGQDGGTVTAHDRSGAVLRVFPGDRRNHHENWAKAVRSRKSSDLTADIEGGHIASALCHAGNISYLVGRKASPGEIREKVRGNRETADAYERMALHLAANNVKEPMMLGEMLTIDPSTERITNNEQANALLRRNYRSPFVVPEKV